MKHRLPLLLLLLLLTASALPAVTPPTVLTLTRTPNGPDFPNITYTLNTLTQNPDGTLSARVTFSAEPQSEPTLILVLSKTDTLIQLNATASDWTPSGNPNGPGPWSYTFTFPPLPPNAPPERILLIPRGRFGLPNGSFEGGGYALVDKTRSAWLGKTGTYTIGTETIEFVGGIAVTKAPKNAPPAPRMMRAFGQSPAKERPIKPTLRGIPLAFPLPQP